MNTYLFPIFVTLSYYVSFQGKTDMPSVCFVCNGCNGHILGYALSVGKSQVSLFERAILHLKSTKYTQRHPIDAAMTFKVLPSTLASENFWADTDQPTHSLNWKLKSKSTIVDDRRIGWYLLPYFYDWTMEDFDMLRQRLTGKLYQGTINIDHATKLIDLAVERFNKSLLEGKEFDVFRY